MCFIVGYLKALYQNKTTQSEQRERTGTNNKNKNESFRNHFHSIHKLCPLQWFEGFIFSFLLWLFHITSSSFPFHSLQLTLYIRLKCIKIPQQMSIPFCNSTQSMWRAIWFGFICQRSELNGYFHRTLTGGFIYLLLVISRFLNRNKFPNVVEFLCETACAVTDINFLFFANKFFVSSIIFPFCFVFVSTLQKW